MSTYDLAVIGEGISGLACAHRAAQLGLSVATFESNLFGGLVVNISSLQGYAAGRPGIELAAEMAEANASLGVESMGVAVSTLRNEGLHIELETDTGVVRARNAVLATGARMRELGVPGEVDFEHRGVSHCADCDGPMLAGMPVVVAGGGDSAYMQAAVLASYASEVTIVFRSEFPRARADLVEAVAGHGRIRVLPRTSVLEVCGSNAVSGVRVGIAGAEQIIPCAGMFVYAGLQPNSELVGTAVSLGASGAVETDDNFRTSRQGLYAIGAVRAGYSGRLVDALKEATRAAEHTASHLQL